MPPKRNVLALRKSHPYVKNKVKCFSCLVVFREYDKVRLVSCEHALHTDCAKNGCCPFCVE